MANPQLSLSPSQTLKKVSIPWVITISYLVVLLVLPAAALFAKSLTLGLAEFWRVATLPISLSAYQVTFFTSLIAGLIDGVFGTIIAWVLVRYRFPGKKIVDACVDLPFALPTSVAGLVLATVYSDNGWLGQFFAPFGIKISFTILGVFVAMLFIALPFIVRTLQPVLQEMEKEVEEAALSLGASSWQIFWRVIFPTILPAILTGVALGFARAIGEYGSVVIISSNIPFKDLIAPVLIFQRLEEYDYTGATVIGMVLLLVSLFMLVVINFLQQWGQKYRVK
ncbi:MULTISPECIES: sulfate ABC transporter permease subunit CysT [unclassified Microcystis]|uniref:sulfate ABC transporter permease subunit CysT n=1 Tax=unclassified Microcystis TaxID=2643300 RepID=UPI0022C9F02C|nr:MULTISPECIES: sulfate ABC transporter permease subunit CysT [unclassified Microcystis]MCA2693019.1 sulfate ABC transporter permease subunit CysT [Microcystis sp. M034S2]MCA2749521.1 sulfate ABC transporter permease subunit CysT [Microcystis sp. M144S2]MCZ8200652.1 sulfate ABC transporter permease subunit CysT [Microcystis sp. LE19-55.1A]MCZ8306953.1 sulfate ABC transporter permease subunit CysT [Microcystis sp. LE19-98.1E]